jgi:hypothetical protein
MKHSTLVCTVVIVYTVYKSHKHYDQNSITIKLHFTDNPILCRPSKSHHQGRYPLNYNTRNSDSKLRLSVNYEDRLKPEMLVL